MTWGMVAVAGATLVGGALQSRSASKAANAAQQGGQASIDEQRRQFDIANANQAPWLQSGGRALGSMEALNNGDFSKFYESPDYKFAMDQGLQGLERGASARGGMYSGGADADRMKFASGLASQNYGSFYNRLAGLAGVGQTTASGLGQLGMGMASNIGNINQNLAAARGSAYQQGGQIGSQMVGGLAGAFNGYMQNRNASQWTGASGVQYGAAPTASTGGNWTNAYGYRA